MVSGESCVQLKFSISKDEALHVINYCDLNKKSEAFKEMNKMSNPLERQNKKKERENTDFIS